MSIVRILFFLGLALLAACGKKSPDATKADGLIPTIYYRPIFYSEDQKCASNDLRDVKTEKGAILTTLCLANFKNCLMQGSCDVIDRGVRKSLGYGGAQKDGSYTFVEIDRNKCPYGIGVKNICLDPYFSVAADLSLYKAGDVLYVPKLAGVTMPDGQVHDGYLIVRDEGQLIKGEGRFDFFTGFLNYTDKSNTLTKLGFSDSDSRIPYEKIADDELAKAVRQRRNYPGIPADVLADGLK